ncbi:MAG: ABC transporter substrate-binding protein [Thermobispora sp.]|nr:ABC transporter substrate-binding protein [Thermobispora sp.]
MRRCLILGVALLALVGCGTGEIRTDVRENVVRAKEATFVIADNLELVTDWDPATSYSNEISAMQNIYESLTFYNPVTKRATPRLAESWTRSADGKVWTFKLRSGVYFHTGRQLDATAVKESIERTRRLAAGAAYIWDVVDTITVKDELTVEFRLKYAAPLDLIASADYAAYIYDTRAAGSKDLKEWFNEGRDAGTGPYTVDTWRKGKENELVLRAFDKYWGGWEGPKYRRIEWRIVPDQKRAWQLLLRGEVNFVERISPALFAQAKRTAGIRTLQVPSFQNMLVLFNTASGPLRDVRVRKAIQKAIDYRGVIAELQGAGTLASGLIPEGLLGHTPGMEPKQDLAAAAELLRQAGYGPGGRELRLVLTYAQGDEEERKLAESMARTLKQLNVTLETRAMQWIPQWNMGKSRDPAKRQDIFVMYWWPDYADAYSWFRNVFRSAEPISFNLTYLQDRTVDSKIDRLPSIVATDRNKAQKAYAELQKILLEEKAVAAVPWVMNYQRAYLGSVRGYTDNPAYPNVVFVYDLIPSG